MHNTRWELNPYSFYDTEGLARHFERMAAEGWAPDRVGLLSVTAASGRRSCALPPPIILMMAAERMARRSFLITVSRRAGGRLRARAS